MKLDLKELAQQYVMAVTFVAPGSWAEECERYPDLVEGWEHDRDQLVKLLELVYNAPR